MIEGTPSPIRKFNPGTFQSDDSVIEQFVVREGELATVCEVLRGNIESPSCQHVLVVAPRGRGKTMLLARVAAEIRTNDEFSRHLLSVRFMEENQEIFDMADFWLETLFHLARECTGEDPDLARELRETHAALSGRWGEQDLADNACAAVLAAADRLDRKLVLMVENLQDLCSDVDEDFAWKLRKVLQTEPQIMLMASATSRFEQLDDAEYPFFEMFRTISLKPLTTMECGRLWQAVSGDEAGRREIRPLEILTGGSPRLLVIVAGFSRHRSLRRLMEELVSLIDEHTEYFRGHLDVLPKTERRVYVAVLDLWQSSSAREIADRARMDIRPVSTLLKRLVDRGVVLVDGLGKKKIYVAAESLYCIYYKLRRERDEAAIVENLLRFMTVFYSETERNEMFPAFISESIEYPAIREGFQRAEIEITNNIEKSSRLVEPEISSTRTELVRQISEAYTKLDFDEIIRTVDNLLTEEGADHFAVSDWSLAYALAAKVFAYREMGDFVAAISTCDRLLERFDASINPGIQLQIADALNDTAAAQMELGDVASALATYGEVVERFGVSDDPDVQWEVCRALNGTAAAQADLGDVASALAAYGEVVERFGASGDPYVQRQVCRALNGTAAAQADLGDAASALAAYGEVVERFGVSDDPDVQWEVCRALNGTAAAQKELGDVALALAAYGEVVERFGASDDPYVQWQVCRALNGTAAAQKELGDAALTLAVYGEVVERFGASDDPGVQWQVCRALNGTAAAQADLGDAASALATYGEVVERFGASDDPDVQWQVCQALNGTAAVQVGLGDAASVLAAYGEVVERFGASDDPDVQWQVCRALNGTAVVQADLGDAASAIATCNRVVERYGASDLAGIQAVVAVILLKKVDILIEIDRVEEALATCDEAERRLDAWDHEQKPLGVWLAASLRIRALAMQGNLRAAISIFQSGYAAFLADNETMIRDMTRLASDLVAAGVLAKDLVEILSSDAVKANALAPLVVALRQHAGETVRAPAEVLEVASDIREGFSPDSR